jgi:hypothetical protein
MIDHVFAEVHRTVRAGFHHESHLNKVLFVRKLIGIFARSLDRVIDSARQRQATPLGTVAQHDPAVVAIMGVRMEYPIHSNSGLAWVVGIGKNRRLLGPTFPGRLSNELPR